MDASAAPKDIPGDFKTGLNANAHRIGVKGDNKFRSDDDPKPAWVVAHEMFKKQGLDVKQPDLINAITVVEPRPAGPAPAVPVSGCAEVVKTGKAKWFTAAPLPRDLCRCSPFFPMNRNKLVGLEFFPSH
jgi:hypothetical protein